MTGTMYDIMHPSDKANRDPDFPSAPMDWDRQGANDLAGQEGLALTEDHWEVVRALQEYFARHRESRIVVRELHDALEEKFHAKGGIKYLYQLFPKGPIAQGCRVSGLEPPGGATDKGFGSVV